MFIPYFGSGPYVLAKIHDAEMVSAEGHELDIDCGCGLSGAPAPMSSGRAGLHICRMRLIATARYSRLGERATLGEGPHCIRQDLAESGVPEGGETKEVGKAMGQNWCVLGGI